MRLPIRIRMTAWYAGLLAIVLLAVGAFVVVRLRSDLVGGIDASLRPAVARIAAGYRQEGGPELHDSAQTALGGERPAAQALDPAGRVVAVFGDPVADRPMLDAAQRAAVLRDGTLTLTRSLGAGDQAFRLAARRTVRRGGPRVVVAAESLAPVQRAVRSVVVLLALAVPTALLLAGAGGWWLAGRALRPIGRMTATAAAIGARRLGDRVPEPGTRDEVHRLACTLNTMLERLERAAGEQRRLVADASHELRSPLAVMRAEIDVTLRADELSPAARRALESTRDEVDRMAGTVEDLLTLARADDGALDLVPEPAELGALAAGVVETLRPIAVRRRVTLSAGGAPVDAVVDARSLGHAVRNVVANAIDFSPEGGRVRVTTSCSGGRARVVVEDEGPGVPAELRERVFDRFYRVDPSRTRATGGSGLGLAITKEIVAAHGGRVWVEGGRPRGSAFVVDLPVDPQADGPPPLSDGPSGSAWSAPSASPRRC